MAKSINQITLLGTIGKDIETAVIGSGTSVSKFSLATNYSRKSADGSWVDETDWHNIKLFGAEGLLPYLVKGKQIALTGRSTTSTWEGKDGKKNYRNEIIADSGSIVLCGGNKTQSATNAGSNENSGEDIPF